MTTAVGPGPRESVVIQHPRHDVVHTRRLDELLALEVVIVRHVQPEKQRSVHQPLAFCLVFTLFIHLKKIIFVEHSSENLQRSSTEMALDQVNVFDGCGYLRGETSLIDAPEVLNLHF